VACAQGLLQRRGEVAGGQAMQSASPAAPPGSGRRPGRGPAPGPTDGSAAAGGPAGCRYHAQPCNNGRIRTAPSWDRLRWFGCRAMSFPPGSV
jgi:hypothetical protein